MGIFLLILMYVFAIIILHKLGITMMQKREQN